MKKLLVICGPTATGKTDLALYLAKLHDGELVSADSRQVYKGLDIGTGKDLKKIGKSQIWGIDIVDPKFKFNVQKYIYIVQKNIKSIWRRNKLPILVGGTGFYIRALIDGISTINIPENPIIRRSAINKNAGELFKKLLKINPIKAGSMNSSDKNNPRRIIRAIEVARWKIDHRSKNIIKDMSFIENNNTSILMIGLFAPKDYLQKLIEERTGRMENEGIVNEIKNLLGKGLSWNDQSMNTIGYKEWKDYFEGSKSKKEVLKEWIKNEVLYAKKQITWFKKDKRINWYNISDKLFIKRVERLVKKWYKEGKI